MCDCCHNCNTNDIQNLIQQVKSSAELFLPEWTKPMMEDLAVGSGYVISIPLFKTGYNNLRLDFHVARINHIEVILSTASGERLGIVHIRTES